MMISIKGTHNKSFKATNVSKPLPAWDLQIQLPEEDTSDDGDDDGDDGLDFLKFCLRQQVHPEFL